MEDFGYKYIPKLPQFSITLNSRRNRPIDMRPNTVKNCELMFILYSQPLREYEKPTFKTGDRVRIWKQVILEGQWEVAISEIFYTSMNQNITEGKFNAFDEKLSKSTTTYNLESGLNNSITEIVEAMNMLIQERNNHNENCIKVKVSRRTRKFVIMLANDTSGLAF